MSAQDAKIYLFCCSSSLDPAELEQGCSEFKHELKTIPLPCSGKIDILYLTKAFESGADGVAVVTCKHGECRYLEGNLRAEKRAGAVDALLDEIGMGKGRMTVIQLSDGGIEQVIADIKDFHSRIKALPAKKQNADSTVPASNLSAQMR